MIVPWAENSKESFDKQAVDAVYSLGSENRAGNFYQPVLLQNGKLDKTNSTNATCTLAASVLLES